LGRQKKDSVLRGRKQKSGRRAQRGGLGNEDWGGDKRVENESSTQIDRGRRMQNKHIVWRKWTKRKKAMVNAKGGLERSIVVGGNKWWTGVKKKRTGM